MHVITLNIHLKRLWSILRKCTEDVALENQGCSLFNSCVVALVCGISLKACNRLNPISTANPMLVVANFAFTK